MVAGRVIWCKQRRSGLPGMAVVDCFVVACLCAGAGSWACLVPALCWRVASRVLAQGPFGWITSTARGARRRWVSASTAPGASTTAGAWWRCYAAQMPAGHGAMRKTLSRLCMCWRCVLGLSVPPWRAVGARASCSALPCAAHLSLSHPARHSDDVAISCAGGNATPPLRLVNGTRLMGRLEIRFNEQYGTVRFFDGLPPGDKAPQQRAHWAGLGARRPAIRDLLSSLFWLICWHAGLLGPVWMELQWSCGGSGVPPAGSANPGTCDTWGGLWGRQARTGRAALLAAGRLILQSHGACSWHGMWATPG